PTMTAITTLMARDRSSVRCSISDIRPSSGTGTAAELIRQRYWADPPPGRHRRPPWPVPPSARWSWLRPARTSWAERPGGRSPPPRCLGAARAPGRHRRRRRGAGSPRGATSAQRDDGVVPAVSLEEAVEVDQVIMADRVAVARLEELGREAPLDQLHPGGHQ